MSDRLKDLEKIVLRLKDQYSEYLDMADEQKRAIIGNRLEKLQEVNLGMESLTQSIADLEKTRLRTMEDLAKSTGEELLNIKDLNRHFHSPTMENLENSVSDLKGVLAKVRDMNRTNTALLQNSRDMIRTTMAIVTGVVHRQKSDNFKTYGSAGSLQSARGQIRTLVNRQG